MKAVKSSAVSAIGYDPGTKILSVQFRHGGLFHYEAVPPHVHAALGRSESKGVFLKTHVIGKYKEKTSV